MKGWQLPQWGVIGGNQESPSPLPPPGATDCSSYFRLGVKGVLFQPCERTSLCYAPSWVCDGANDCGDSSYCSKEPSAAPASSRSKAQVLLLQAPGPPAAASAPVGWSRIRTQLPDHEFWELMKGRTTVSLYWAFGLGGGQLDTCMTSQGGSPFPVPVADAQPTPPSADSRRCKKTFRQCSNGRCVSNMLWCNGADDCGDGSDEIPCNSE